VQVIEEMGIMDRFFRQEIGGIDLQKEALEEQLYLSQMAQQGMGYTGGQPLPPVPMTVIPPAMEKEVMEKYLDVPIPENLDQLKGTDRFWLMTSPVTRHMAFSNLNANQQKQILTELQNAIDMDGCDNVDGLIQNKQLLALSRILTNKSRSDLPDGIRERLVPSIGWSIGESKLGHGREAGERPKESRAMFGLFSWQQLVLPTSTNMDYWGIYPSSCSASNVINHSKACQ
jgi:hypothetical protein